HGVARLEPDQELVVTGCAGDRGDPGVAHAGERDRRDRAVLQGFQAQPAVRPGGWLPGGVEEPRAQGAEHGCKAVWIGEGGGRAGGGAVPEGRRGLPEEAGRASPTRRLAWPGRIPFRVGKKVVAVRGAARYLQH